jgi:hypothetical protein
MEVPACHKRLISVRNTFGLLHEKLGCSYVNEDWGGKENNIKDMEFLKDGPAVIE